MDPFRQFPGRLIASCLLWLVALAAPTFAATPPTVLDRDTLVFGAISNDPKKHIRFSKPLADYLAANLQDVGIKRARVMVANDLDQMGHWLASGEVDLVSETLFSALALQQHYDAELFLRRWKRGVGQYSSVFFVRQDSGIETLDDLQGKVIAFEDRGSSSGYYIPASLLLSLGYELAEMKSLNQPVPQHKIGYVFTDDALNNRNEVNISAWVYRGIVDAGSFSNINWDDPEDMPAPIRNQLHIIHESSAFPRAIQLVRPDLEPTLKARLKQLLLNAHTTEQGRKALYAYQKTSHFDALPSASSETMVQATVLREIVDKRL